MFGKSDVLRFGGWQPEYYEFLRENFCPRLAKMKIRGQFADKTEIKNLYSSIYQINRDL